jgi:Na+/H+ antiporter NhaC
MLGSAIALAIVGFIVFLMVDSQKRYEEIKQANPEEAKHYTFNQALMMTMFVIIIIVLLVMARRWM